MTMDTEDYHESVPVTARVPCNNDNSMARTNHYYHEICISYCPARVQYMACCTRAPAITNLLPNDVKLV